MNTNILLQKTSWVIFTTILTMIVEIYFGFKTHSMALLSDGFHMGTHAFALLITLFICIFALKHKDKEEKLNAIGGYTSAVLLFITAIGIIFESINRLIHPIGISFSQAILVAVIGLIVNAVCILIMGGQHHHHNEHHHDHQDENLNYKAAYLHILADLLTSVFAICALLLAKYFNLLFLDPIVGLISGLIIIKWAISLINESLKILI